MAEQTPIKIAWHETLQAAIIGSPLLLFYLLIFLCVICFDRVPYWFRTQRACFGLRPEHRQLLRALNHARGQLSASFDAPGTEDAEELNERYITRCYACWEAGIDPQRIELAGGAEVHRTKPYIPQPIPRVA